MVPDAKKELELSIIIPCYNCEVTLSEAVESCYQQGFSNDEFEIVMVDDGSTDNTRDVMEELASKHKNIRLFFHKTNKGGGATRNTATKETFSELIFCLDSDDILTPKMLELMVKMQKETNADGIGVEKSVKFYGTDTNNIAFTNIFGYKNELIPLVSLLQFNDVMCPLYSTFLYTKTGFNKINGYPTTHGFDTQGFAWRFLAKGLRAYTCPGTTYLHRINFSESYYLREYNKGRTNTNWKKILLEQNAVLCDDAFDFVTNFNELDFEVSIIDELKNLPHIFSRVSTNRIVNIESMVAKKSVSRNSLRGLFYRTRSRLKKVVRSIVTKASMYIAFIKKHNQSQEPFYTLLIWHLSRLKKKIHINFNTPEKKKVEVIDLFLPTIAKDFETLQLVIEGAKKYLQHTIGTIYIVTHVNDEMDEFCTINGYKLIDETSVLGYGKEKINYFVGDSDRSGWLFQQLLKLAADKIVETENFISIDSDTILIRPHSFIEKDAFIFRQNEEWHEPYFKAFKKIFGYPVRTWFSYTSHMMIFNKKMLQDLKLELEQRHGKSWDKVYIETADSTEMSCISDYETYANWVRCNFPSKVKSTVLYNKTLTRHELTDLLTLEQKYANKYHSVSFHSYARNVT